MNLTSLNIILADAAPATPSGPPGLLTQVPFLVAMVVLFYVFILRPQSKKTKEHTALLKAIKPGDKIVTNGGLVGVVVSVKENTVSLRSAETKLEVLKSAVAQITERAGETTAAESN